MGTYRDRNHTIPETKSAPPPFSHYAWFNPSNFYSLPKPNLNHLQSTQVKNTEPIFISPIRSVANNVDLETKPPSKPEKKHKCFKKSPNEKPKQARKKSSSSKMTKMPEAKREKKDPNMVNLGRNFDFSGVPSPVCSCTGMARVCYKWGVGGWQSSCCTINLSEYPLPMRPTRPGARLAGRKMSNGAYGNLLIKLEAEGYDFTLPVDMKNHWARHGTNKFVTLK